MMGVDMVDAQVAVVAITGVFAFILVVILTWLVK